ncbi:hypothetical protein EBZ38_07975 [bacterium]|nr:hypothetical protein [bacterium]
MKDIGNFFWNKMRTKQMTEDEKFAIYWCFNRAMERIEQTLVVDHRDLIVDGVNINETIKELLRDRLFV